jgi:hypothetical protein
MELRASGLHDGLALGYGDAESKLLGVGRE